MAILDKVKSKKTAKVKEEKGDAVATTNEAISKASKFAAGVLIAPHVTEKSAMANGLNCYVFKVNPRSNRSMVKQAIKEVYNVIPRKVNITVIPDRAVFIKRKKGVKLGYKKAVVFLKKGDKIAIN